MRLSGRHCRTVSQTSEYNIQPTCMPVLQVGIVEQSLIPVTASQKDPALAGSAWQIVQCQSTMCHVWGGGKIGRGWQPTSLGFSSSGWQVGSFEASVCGFKCADDPMHCQDIDTKCFA